MAWARRIVAAEGSERPMCLIFPALGMVRMASGSECGKGLGEGE